MAISSEVERLGDAEFKWGKKRGLGGKKKEVQFYESFTYDGVEYTLHDCVYMHKEGASEPYIGKLIKIWDDKSKRIKVQWFFRPSENGYWLEYHKVDALANEIFFASGEGVGLSNVNPLEAIAGKCNVVCISKDIRNPQPSAEQLKMADYLFYRTFDVKNCVILDNMDDKVGGLNVKFVFNRKENDMFNGSKLVSKPKEDDGRITGFLEGTLQIVENKALDVSANGKEDANHDHLVAKKDSDVEKVSVKGKTPLGQVEDGLDHLKPTLGERPAPGVATVTAEVDTNIVEKNNAFGCDANVVTDEISDNRLPVNQVEAEEGVKSGKDPGSSENRPPKRAKFDRSSKLTKDKDIILVEKSTATGNDAKTAMPGVISSGEKTKAGHSKEIVRLEKNKKLAKESSTLDHRPLKKQRFQESAKVSEENNSNYTAGAGNSVVDKTKEKPNEQLNKLTETLSNLDKNPSRETSKEKNDKPITSLEKNPHKESLNKTISEAMELGKGQSKGEHNEKRCNRMETSFGKDRTNPKGKLDKKRSMLPNENLAKVSKPCTSNANEIVEGRIIEVTRRPNDDNASWFRSLPWEERMQTANEQRSLVLLQNLDLECTSAEVEDIVWHVFKENCTAKMVQHLAYSSPLYGQALVIFKTREAAEKVVRKLDDGCLVVMNQRPIVGRIQVLPKITRKQSTFVGHLYIDKIKLQMQKDKDVKEALSTSHSSQPNTIEYELAMKWCLLRSRLEFAWERLYKKQGEELKGPMANLKLK